MKYSKFTRIIILVIIYAALLFIYINYSNRFFFKDIGIWGILAIAFFILSLPIYILQPKQFIEFFFGKNTRTHTPAEILKYIGIICGAFIVLGTLQTNNETNRLVLQGNNLTKKGQLDNRFIEASKLLSSNNTSENISGIYALHQIAIETSKSEDQNEYVRVINEILCSYIRENSLIKKNENATKVENNKPTIVIQTILDVLFHVSDTIYVNCISNLENSVFIDIDLSNKILCNVSFKYSSFRNVDCSNSLFKNINFNYATLHKTNFSQYNIRSKDRVDAIIPSRSNIVYEPLFCTPPYLSNVSFLSTLIEDSGFEAVALDNVRFFSAEFNSVYMVPSIFKNVNFEYCIYDNLFLDTISYFSEISFPEKYLKFINIEEEFTKKSNITWD